MVCGFVVAAALLAAHLAFIDAASCARRSGVRFSFLFTFFGATWCPCGSRSSLASLPSGTARFPFNFSRACGLGRYMFSFQLGKLLCILLQAGFESPDFFGQILKLHMG